MREVDGNIPDVKIERAQREFPGFKLFADFDLQSMGERLLAYFGAFSPAEKKALSAYVMDNATGQDFGKVLRLLRIVNGLQGAEVAEVAYGDAAAKTRVRAIETGDRDFTGKQFSRLQTRNLFELSDAHKEQLFDLWQKRTQRMFECNSVDELFSAVRTQLAEYAAGQRPLLEVDDRPGLITRNDVLRTLFNLRQLDHDYNVQPEFKSLNNFSLSVFPGHPARHATYALNGKTVLKDDLLAPMLEKLGFTKTSGAFELIRKLPFATHDPDCMKKFEISVRDAMVTPEVARVFMYPARYDSSGAWLEALRLAAQKTQKEMGGRVVEKQMVSAWERNTKSPSIKACNALWNLNSYSLPEDMLGQPMRDRFTRLAQCKMEGWRPCLQQLGLDLPPSLDWEQTQEQLSHAMAIEASSAAWQQYLDKVIKPQLAVMHADEQPFEVTQCNIAIEERTVRVMRQGHEIRFAKEDIQQLCADASAQQRLKLLLRRYEPRDRIHE